MFKGRRGCDCGGGGGGGGGVFTTSLVMVQIGPNTILRWIDNNK